MKGNPKVKVFGSLILFLYGVILIFKVHDLPPKMIYISCVETHYTIMCGVYGTVL